MKTRTIPACLTLRLTALTAVLTTGVQADTLDLSSHFDAASDFTEMSVEFNYEEAAGHPPILTTSFTTSITDLGGSPNVIGFLVDRDDAGAAALSFLSTATFDPSVQGMLKGIDWSTTVTDPNTGGKDDGANFPLLAQGGKLYRYTGGDILNTDHGTANAFQNILGDTVTQTLAGAVASDFEELDGTTPDWTDDFGPKVMVGSHPDFSEAGGEITFGYLTTSRTSDPGGQSNETRNEGTVVTLKFGAPALIHHWKLDETSGLVASDSVGDLDLTLQGFADTTSHWVPGRHGGGLRLDGVDDWGYNDTGTAPFTTAADHTVALWIKYDVEHVGNTQRWISWGGFDGGVWGRYYMGIQNSGNFSVGIGAGVAATADGLAAPSTTVFEHWAAVREGSTVTLYRNGVVVPTASVNNIDGDIHPISVAMPLTLGRLTPSYDPDVRWTDGVMDDVAIWDGPLTVDQIGNAMAFGAGQIEAAQCLGGLMCTTDQEAGTVTLSWNPPDPALDATGIKVERNGVEIASLALTATGYVDAPPLPGSGQVSFDYTVHTYGGAEGDNCPVRLCTAPFDLGAPPALGSIDLSSSFDEASDFTAPILEWNSAGTLVPTVTDVSGAVHFETNRSDAAGSGFASTLSSATFNPSVSGAITNINWSNDVQLVAGASAGQIMPLISQGGTLYVYKGNDINPATAIAGNTFYNFNTPSPPGWLVGQFIDDVVVASDFEELLTSPGSWSGGAGGGPGSIAASNPDFSVAGGEMTFGYLMVNASGSTVNRDNKTLLDNTVMSVDYTPISGSTTIKITGISTNLASDEVTLTWTADGTGPFNVFAGADLQDFGTQVATGVTSPATITLPTPLHSEPAVFFRVSD